MAMQLQDVFEFDIADAGGTVYHDHLFEAVDVSVGDVIKCILELDSQTTDPGDTLDVFLCCRFQDGYWQDRIHFTQLTDTPTPLNKWQADIQKFGTLTDQEEENLILGPGTDLGTEAGSVTRLSAGGVQNGGFPGIFYEQKVGKAYRSPAASWGIQIKQAGGAWVGRVRTYLDTVPLP